MANAAGQATLEYVILLAFALLVVIVVLDILSGSSDSSNDTMMAENKVYWQSASPIAIIESAAYGVNEGATLAWCDYHVHPYIRVKNTGPFPIRITKILDGNNYVDQVKIVVGGGGCTPMGDLYYLAPSEEAYFADKEQFPEVPYYRNIAFTNKTSGLGSCSTCSWLLGIKSICTNATANSNSLGYVRIEHFGFEYVEYIGANNFTKRQVGSKPLILKCDFFVREDT